MIYSVCSKITSVSRGVPGQRSDIRYHYHCANVPPKDDRKPDILWTVVLFDNCHPVACSAVALLFH